MSAISGEEQKPGELRIRLEDLPASHTALAKALGEKGIGGEKAHQLFEKSIYASCIGCGLKVSGVELGQISMAGGDNPTTENKLDRLRLGYCGRLGCDSKFYQLHCLPAEGINPQTLLQRAEKLRNEPTSEPVVQEEKGPNLPWWRVPRNRIIAGIGVVAIYFVWRIFGPDGPVPVVKRESPYQVETNNVPTSYGPVSGSGEVVR